MTREQEAQILECRMQFMELAERLRAIGVTVLVCDFEERHAAGIELQLFVVCDVPPLPEKVAN